MREIVQDACVGYRFRPDDPASLGDQFRAICDAHVAGTLNAFDASTFLAGRDEASYLAGVLRAYAGGGG
jgi:hypothetical protein